MTGHYFILVSLAVLGAVGAAAISWILRLHKQVQKTIQRGGEEKQNLRHEFILRFQPLEKAFYQQQSGVETMVYDGRMAVNANDFEGGGARAWDYVGHCFAEGEGQGSHEIAGNVIIINRRNTAGRYELFLKRFSFDGVDHNVVPSSATQKQRRLRLSCDVRRDAASHVLRFVFKGESTKEVLDEKDVVVFNPEWQSVELFFALPTTEDCRLRIDDLEVLEAPSKIQIRNLALWEKR